MENFVGSILERDYGFKSGKNAPMVSSTGGSSAGSGYGGLRKSVPGTRSSYGSRNDLFSPAAYDDVFGGPPKGSEGGARYDDVFGSSAPQGAPVFDDLLGGYGGGSIPKVVKSGSGSFHSSPRRSDRSHFVSSEPVYDELLPGFDFLPKSRSSSEMKAPREPDPFAPLGSDPLASSGAGGTFTATFDEGLLPGFDSGKSRSFSGDAKVSREPDPLLPMFDDPMPSSIPPSSSPFVDDGLLPGFSNEGAKSRSLRESKAPVQDSFGSLGDEAVSSSIPSGSHSFDDLLNAFNDHPSNANSSCTPGNGVKLDRFDTFDSFPQSPGNSSFFQDSARKTEEDASRTPAAEEEVAFNREGFHVDDISQVSPDSEPFFSSHSESSKPTAGSGSSDQPQEEAPAWDFPSTDEPHLDRGFSGSIRSKEMKDAWLTIDDMKLMTQPSHVPPPSRRPPPLPGSGSGLGEKIDARDTEFATFTPSASTPEEETMSSGAAPPTYEQAVPGWKDFHIQRDEEKERAEAEARRERRRQEREEARVSRENREKEIREQEARHELKEREARLAREQERLRREKEREKDRAAVRIATLEARERAAQEAREKAERSAVERATGEARERAASQARARVERAAVERANAEARERAEVRAQVDKAAAEARERAERAAADKAAGERAAGEVREKSARAAAEKAAVERLQSEARERAARAAAEKAAEKAAVERAGAEARERAERVSAEKAAAARERSQQQRKSENDLESIFGHPAAPASNDTRPRPASMNSNNTNVFGEPRRTSSGTATTTASSVDDWTSIFGVVPSSDDSQDGRRGETGKSSRGRSDRMAHTRERAAKAIAEINQRDLELQREQAEKHRAGDVLDSEIKRWAAGKEGNLRALLSTLQYVLWPECGWTPVSLTDLINPASVKKTYRKATLYVHPDKVQQKGATVQQKYIAEKVFDLLKEAWNKFNSEELF